MIYDRGIAARVNGKVYKMILMYGLKMVAQTNGQEAELKTSTFPLKLPDLTGLQMSTSKGGAVWRQS